MNKFLFSNILFALSALCTLAQVPIDTTGIYGERRDSLEATVFVSRQAGNYLARGKGIRTEIITASGLCKMACCNLSESFENSASVSVGYSDAVTGARQIRLLGQSGVYTQMLDENRPVMRGLSAPWGLNYIPGQWLESIQIAKGATSVTNGAESMTGQINIVHRKTTDEKPLYVQASFMDDTKADLNIISSLQLDDLSRWSTVILAHVDGNFKAVDHNKDGFMDDPRQLNFALSNRWLYFGQDGMQVHFGVRAIRDSRKGGQIEESGWKSTIRNDSFNGYAKMGIPISEDGDRSIALITDYTFQKLRSNFAERRYDAGQHSIFANLMYQDISSDNHRLSLGLSEMLDIYDEDIIGTGTGSRLNDLGLYGEYTFHAGDGFSTIIGLRGDWFNGVGGRFTPRLTLKWAPAEALVFRANGGRGLRYSNPLLDNIGVLSTNKVILGDYLEHTLEDSWTCGANATWHLPFDKEKNTYLSLDYFHTSFTEQLLYDNTGSIRFYRLSSLPGAVSHTNNIQVDFSSEPFRGFTFTLTGRFTDARQTLSCQSDDMKPMTNRYKAVLNMQYATRLEKWIFDFTASINGPCRIWDFMKGLNGRYADGFTPSYPLLYAQVTKRFKGFDIYVGGENLTGYTQPDPIISANDPGSPAFDASCIWGPLTGLKIYGGVRLTIWKTEKL